MPVGRTPAQLPIPAQTCKRRILRARSRSAGHLESPRTCSGKPEASRCRLRRGTRVRDSILGSVSLSAMPPSNRSSALARVHPRPPGRSSISAAPPCSSGKRCVFSLRFVAFCLVALSCAPARPASLCPALSPFHPAFPRPSSVLPLPAVPYGGGRIAVSSVGWKVNCWIVGEMGRVEEEGRDPVDPENARFGFSVWRSREKNGHRREMAQGHEGSIPSCKHIELHR